MLKMDEVKSAFDSFEKLTRVKSRLNPIFPKYTSLYLISQPAQWVLAVYHTKSPSFAYLCYLLVILLDVDSSSSPRSAFECNLV